ncbi:hypothetical protein HDU96_006947 [Phlyctochytrium bullatum]|nr:hypothetical protein HDU96_006947 [Phlyctochytrium bullatum]
MIRSIFAKVSLGPIVTTSICSAIFLEDKYTIDESCGSISAYVAKLEAAKEDVQLKPIAERILGSKSPRRPNSGRNADAANSFTQDERKRETTSERSSNNSDMFKGAIDDLKQSSAPLKAHGLSVLRQLFKDRDKAVLSQIEVAIDMILQAIHDEEE